MSGLGRAYLLSSHDLQSGSLHKAWVERGGGEEADTCLSSPLRKVFSDSPAQVRRGTMETQSCYVQQNGQTALTYALCALSEVYLLVIGWLMIDSRAYSIPRIGRVRRANRLFALSPQLSKLSTSWLPIVMPVRSLFSLKSYGREEKPKPLVLRKESSVQLLSWLICGQHCHHYPLQEGHPAHKTIHPGLMTPAHFICKIL